MGVLRTSAPNVGKRWPQRRPAALLIGIIFLLSSGDFSCVSGAKISASAREGLSSEASYLWRRGEPTLQMQSRQAGNAAENESSNGLSGTTNGIMEADMKNMSEAEVDKSKAFGKSLTKGASEVPEKVAETLPKPNTTELAAGATEGLSGAKSSVEQFVDSFVNGLTFLGLLPNHVHDSIIVAQDRLETFSTADGFPGWELTFLFFGSFLFLRSISKNKPDNWKANPEIQGDASPDTNLNSRGRSSSSSGGSSSYYGGFWLLLRILKTIGKHPTDMFETNSEGALNANDDLASAFTDGLKEQQPSGDDEDETSEQQDGNSTKPADVYWGGEGPGWKSELKILAFGFILVLIAWHPKKPSLLRGNKQKLPDPFPDGNWGPLGSLTSSSGTSMFSYGSSAIGHRRLPKFMPSELLRPPEDIYNDMMGEAASSAAEGERGNKRGASSSFAGRSAKIQVLRQRLEVSVDGQGSEIARARQKQRIAGGSNMCQQLIREGAFAGNSCRCLPPLDAAGGSADRLLTVDSSLAARELQVELWCKVYDADFGVEIESRVTVWPCADPSPEAQLLLLLPDQVDSKPLVDTGRLGGSRSSEALSSRANMREEGSAGGVAATSEALVPGVGIKVGGVSYSAKVVARVESTGSRRARLDFYVDYCTPQRGKAAEGPMHLKSFCWGQTVGQPLQVTATLLDTEAFCTGLTDAPSGVGK